MGLGIGDVYGTNRGRLTLQLRVRQVHSSIDVAMKYTVLRSFCHISEA